MGGGRAGHRCCEFWPDHSASPWGLCLPHPLLRSVCPCSFRNFDVEESHQCSLDWLLLGPAAPPRQEAFRLCGSAIPPAFISARDHVWIFFHSDASSSGQAQGFRLSYIRGDANQRSGWGHHGMLEVWLLGWGSVLYLLLAGLTLTSPDHLRMWVGLSCCCPRTSPGH